MKKKHWQAGVSLLEITLSLTIIIAITAFTIPNIWTGVQNMRLRSSVSDFSGLVQRARLAAVTTNSTYTILFNLPNPETGAYVDLNGNGSFDNALSPAVGGFASEPMVQFGSGVTHAAAPGGTSGAASNLDGASGALGWTATSGNISFNPRGIPCSNSSTPCTTNVNFVFYFTVAHGNGALDWAAVSIDAAGHPRQWFWNGTSWIN